MPDSFATISSPGRSELREKASRFFGFAEHLTGEAQAAAMRGRLKKEYHDASHQPFAYRLATGAVRTSDEGEPKGTAGPPILAEIGRAKLYDVQVVVVRYFGGTKLGKGGLARAIAECARLALENAGRRREEVVGYLDVKAAPELINTVKAVAVRFGAQVVALSFGLQAQLRFSVPAARLDECREALLKRFGPQIF
jgi:putative IMPACT (imprinted ancient) family translation regulator